MEKIRARKSVSISDLKKNPSGVILESSGEAVAILNHNRPTAYLLAAQVFEAIMDRLDDADLARIVNERQGETSLAVNIHEL